MYNSADRKFGYNISEAGNNKQAEETKKKMSEARKGKKATAETKRNMSKAHGGIGTSIRISTPGIKTKVKSLNIGSIKKRMAKRKKEEENED